LVINDTKKPGFYGPGFSISWEFTPRLSTFPTKEKSTAAPIQQAAIGPELVLFEQVTGADVGHGLNEISGWKPASNKKPELMGPGGVKLQRGAEIRQTYRAGAAVPAASYPNYL
jgi:hypothetical protein